MMTFEHVLHGCAPVPLAGYLKALESLPPCRRAGGPRCARLLARRALRVADMALGRGTRAILPGYI